MSNRSARLYPAIVSGLMFFAGFRLFLDSAGGAPTEAVEMTALRKKSLMIQAMRAEEFNYYLTKPSHTAMASCRGVSRRSRACCCGVLLKG